MLPNSNGYQAISYSRMVFDGTNTSSNWKFSCEVIKRILDFCCSEVRWTIREMQAATSLARKLPNTPLHTSANFQSRRYDEAPVILTGLIVPNNSSNSHLTIAYIITMTLPITTEHDHSL